jgi:hypothetical protein
MLRCKRYNESVKSWLDLRESTKKQTIIFSRKRYDFVFPLLFCDGMTSYFETFKEDKLKRNGFSKHIKSQQLKIAAALISTPKG